MSDFPGPIPGPTRGPIPVPIPAQFLAQFRAQFLLNSWPNSGPNSSSIPSPIPGPIPAQFRAQFLAQFLAQFRAQFLPNSWPISTYPSRYNQPNTMDIGLPALSPSRVNFMPSLLPLARGGVDPWPNSDDLNIQFMDMVLKNKSNCLLTPLKRSDYRYYLNNRTATS